MRKAISITAVLIVTLTSCSLSFWGSDVPRDGGEAVTALFADLTEAAFMKELGKNGSIEYTEGAVHSSITLDSYGESEAEGELEIIFQGTSNNGIFIAERYLMNGSLSALGIPVVIENAAAKTNAIMFSTGDSIELVSDGNLRYPAAGSIKAGDDNNTAIVLFPEDTDGLSSNEIKALQKAVDEAFSLFDVLPDKEETKLLENGSAIFSADSSGNWTMRIHTGEYVLTLSSARTDAVIILNEKTYSLPSKVLIANTEIPTLTSLDKTAGDYLEALRKSNLMFALEALVNGSKSGVITLTSSSLDEVFKAELDLEDYGIAGTEITVTGKLLMTFSGEIEDGSLTAVRYKADSERLLFSENGEVFEIALSAVEGKLSGDGEAFFRVAEENGELTAEGSSDLILGLPDSGYAQYGERKLSF